MFNWLEKFGAEIDNWVQSGPDDAQENTPEKEMWVDALKSMLGFVRSKLWASYIALSLFIACPLIAYVCFSVAEGFSDTEQYVYKGDVFEKQQIIEHIESGAIDADLVEYKLVPEYGKSTGLVWFGKFLLKISWLASVVYLLVTWIMIFVLARLVEKGANNFGKERISPITVQVMLKKIASAVAWITVINFLLMVIPFENYAPNLMILFWGGFLMLAIMVVGWELPSPVFAQRVLAGTAKLGLLIIIMTVGMQAVLPNTWKQYMGESTDGVSLRGTFDNLGEDVGIAGKRWVGDLGDWFADRDTNIRSKTGRSLVKREKSISASERRQRNLRAEGQELQDLINEVD